MFKIVQLIPALALGGAEIFCINLSNELAKNPDNEVTLISMFDHTPALLPLSMIDKKVKFISLGKKKGPDIKIVGKLYQAIVSEQPDVVHTHMHTGYYTLYSAWKLHKKTRFFHTFHNPVKMESPKWIMRRFYEIFFRKKIYYTRKYYKRNIGWRKKRIW